eukprot:1251831-Amphidinium_carterae.1
MLLHTLNNGGTQVPSMHPKMTTDAVPPTCTVSRSRNPETWPKPRTWLPTSDARSVCHSQGAETEPVQQQTQSPDECS